MSDTPETDAFQSSGVAHYMAGEFARKLERERDEARGDLDNMQDQRDLAMKAIKRLEGEHDQTRERWRSAVIYWQRDVFKMQRERDEARTELEMWRDGNIMHQIHRDELEKVERERDEARAQLKAMQLEIEAMNQRLREP